MRWWEPEALAERLPFLKIRTAVIDALRSTMGARGYTEVQTPILQKCPGIEVYLTPFQTEMVSRDMQAREKMFLRFAPELAHKKLIAGGAGNIFELATVFRNGDFSARHQPEFIMLEWYAMNESYHALMEDCRALVQGAARAAGRKTFLWNGMDCDPFKEWEVLRIPEAFHRYAGIDVLATMGDSLETMDTRRLQEEARRIGLSIRDEMPWDDVFFMILQEKIEPFLGQGRPTLLCDYPGYQTVLTKPCEDEPRLCERFELYACGLELANGMTERTDPVLQRKLFVSEMALKKELFGADCPVDEDFLTAQESGMPPCAGIGLGVERLVMLCAGAERLDQVLWAPVEMPA